MSRLVIYIPTVVVYVVYCYPSWNIVVTFVIAILGFTIDNPSTMRTKLWKIPTAMSIGYWYRCKW